MFRMGNWILRIEMMCRILSYKYIPKPFSPHMHAITHVLQMQLVNLDFWRIPTMRGMFLQKGIYSFSF